MKFIVCKDYDEMSRKGAEIIAALLKSKPDCVLGLATGSTPVGMYKDLAEMNKTARSPSRMSLPTISTNTTLSLPITVRATAIS